MRKLLKLAIQLNVCKYPGFSSAKSWHTRCQVAPQSSFQRRTTLSIRGYHPLWSIVSWLPHTTSDQSPPATRDSMSLQPDRSGNSFIVTRHMVVDKEMEW